jgi:cytochrome P450
MARDPYTGLMGLYQRYGPACRFGRFKGYRYVFLFGREGNELLQSDDPNLLWRDVLSLLLPVVGDTAMVVTDGPAHRRLHRLVQPAFSIRRINECLPIMLDELHRTIDGWRPGTEVDAFGELRACIRRIAIRALFGERLRDRADEIGENLDLAMRYVNRSFVRFDRDLPGTAYRRAMAARRHVDDILFREIEVRRARPGETDDVLDALISAQDDDGGGLTDQEVRDQVVSLTASGYDSSSAAAGWAVQALLTHYLVTAKLRAEVEAVVGDDPLTIEHLQAMPYLAATVNEVLRLYTPGVATGRKAVEGFDFLGYEVPAGSFVIYSQYVTHRIPELWPDPYAFKPERWDPAEPGYRPPLPYSFVPFGGGYRRCIGFAFATTELMAIIVELLRRTDLVATTEHIDPTGVATMLPRGGVPVRVRAVYPAGRRPAAV